MIGTFNMKPFQFNKMRYMRGVILKRNNEIVLKASERGVKNDS